MLKRIFILAFALLFSFTIFATSHQPQCRCQPNQSCWPNQKAWSALAKQLTGKLVKPISPLAACHKNAKSKACLAALKAVKNPFVLQNMPGGTQSQGWLNAWKDQNSVYAVEAANTKDVVAAVNFARHYNLRLAIKGAGHDYLGRSNAANSLLIWTHNMRHITYHKHFIPTGCSPKTKANTAITVGAGTRWIEAYTAATTKHDQYVQGGGCATVGAAGGFTQGGGFGSYSKEFGTGAAGILQVKVVTASGKTLIANQCQNKKLFWAIRGGGGGTFGVVTKMTLKTHPLPKYFGVLEGTITAKNNKAYQKLIQRYLLFFRNRLNNPHWGEQFTFTPQNKIKVFMMWQGMNKQSAQKTWRPLLKWITAHNNQFSIKTKFISIPPRNMWNLKYWEKYHPEFVTPNIGKNARPGEYWWTPNSGEVYNYWYTYQSWWLPLRLLNKNNIQKTATVFYKASRLASVALHINKGLAGASKEAIAQGLKTSTNPKVYHAAALIIMGAASNKVYLGVKGKQPNIKKAEKKIQAITRAMHLFMKAAPNAGTYANEANYFQKNWQRDFWGQNYRKLLKIKKEYDPKGLFFCHHCVGSEFWNKNGMCR